MRILMLTSEAVPFAKTGGLADAVPALAVALSELGHDVRLAMPRYYRIDKRLLDAHLSPLGVPMGTGELWCGVFETRLPNSQVPVYMLDREDLFGRDGLYGPDGSSSWPDNARRFAFFSSASFQLCRHLGWTPDILNLHDWQAAPAAWILKSHERKREFAETASVVTVHNLGYQGVYPVTALKHFPSSTVSADAESIILANDVNFLHAGLQCADAITTVSPTYAQEILEPAYSEGLGDVLTSRKGRISGILNGMDYSEWNPAGDSALAPDNYDINDMGGKNRLKNRLQEEMGLVVNPEVPLFGVVTRLTGQKGIDLLVDPQGPVQELIREGKAQLAVLGSGEERYERGMLALATELKGRCAVKIAFSNRLSRLIEGGSDFFLMPSRYEPCGLNQMYSLRYGTLPVVRNTGGLADTVVDLDAHPRKGNGFVFDAATPNDLAQAMGRAIRFYGRNKSMVSARKRGMKARFDWNASAKEYEAVFKKALSRRG